MIAGREHEISPILREFVNFVAADPPLTVARLMDAWIGRDELRLRLLAEMRDVPVFICPTCSIPAFRHGELEWTIRRRDRPLSARSGRDDVHTMVQLARQSCDGGSGGPLTRKVCRSAYR